MLEDKYIKQQRVYKIAMFGILTALITFMVTSLSLYTYFSSENADKNDSSVIATEEQIKKVRSVIDKYYLWKDEINEKDLEDAAISGYVSGLGDKYTEYIPKKDVSSFQENITGTFVGIGVYMQADIEKGIVVSDTISESPAEKAGLIPGDIIKKVDDIEYGYNDFDIIPNYIKGEEGTEVKITIEREGEEIDFNIIRQKIKTKSVLAEMLENNIGYVLISSFDSNTSDMFKNSLDDLIKEGAKSLIIDLRNNGGGIVDEATNIADLFLENNQKIMITKDNNNNEEITKSQNNKIYDMPVIILANKNSASASEILISALMDNNIAKVIGENTFGKGIIQTVITLSDGSAIKITTAEYFTPAGKAIHGVGLKPDIEVEETGDNTEVDAQLQRAIQELQ